MEGIPHRRLTLEICPVPDARMKEELENDQVVDTVGPNVSPFLRSTVSNGEAKDYNWRSFAGRSGLRSGKRIKMEKAELPEDEKQLSTHNLEDVKTKVENDNGANGSRNGSSKEDLPSISPEEETLSNQRQLISRKFPKSMDRCNSAKFHGLKDIALGEKMKQGRMQLEKTYECLCGSDWTSYATFRKHYNNEILVDLRCLFCTKKFKEESTLREHCWKRHGNTFNADEKLEEGAEQSAIESDLDAVESNETEVNPGDDNGEVKDESSVAKKIAALEKRIPSQMKYFFGKFTPAKDVTNPCKFHGLAEIVSKGKLDGNRLLKSYNCICGMECASYTDFRRHYNSELKRGFL